MILSAVFQTTKDNANDGKIVATFQDNLGTSGTPFTIGLGVTSPTGDLISDVLVNVAVLAIGGTNTLTVDIPLDSSGAYLGGEYQLELSYYNADSSESDVLEATYMYTPYHSPDHLTSSLVTLATVVSCDAETLVATDTTTYGDVEIVVRALTTTPPVITGDSPNTTSGATLTTGITYTNVTYATLLDVDFQYNESTPAEDFSLISKGTATIYKEDVIDCDPKLCNLVSCLSSKFNALKTKANASGGWATLSAQDRSNFEYAQSLIVLGQMLRNCGLYDRAAPYIAEAADILNCDCGCSTTTNPTPL